MSIKCLFSEKGNKKMAMRINVKNGSKSNTIRRASVAKGDVYIIPKNKKQEGVYMALGRRSVPPSDDNRWMSLNLVTGEEASTSNGEFTVELVGTSSTEITFGPGYEHLAAKLKKDIR